MFEGGLLASATLFSYMHDGAQILSSVRGDVCCDSRQIIACMSKFLDGFGGKRFGRGGCRLGRWNLGSI